MRCYWLQNDPTNFETIVQKFIICLTERGHQLQDLSPLFQQAARFISNQRTQQENRNSPNTLYIHQRYHPKGLQRKDIMDIYDRMLKQILNFDTMTVAISRPRNLRKVLTKTSLIKPPSLDIQHLIEEIMSSNS